MSNLHPTCSRDTANRGLSLTELVVVVGIITLLAVILIPLLPGFQGKALQLRCSNNLKELGTSLFLYSEQNGGHLPDFRFSRWCGVVNQTSPEVYTWRTLDDGTIVWFIDDRDSKEFHCPSQPIARLNTQGIRSHYAGLSIHSFHGLQDFEKPESSVLLFEYEADPAQVLESRGTQQAILYAYDSFEPGFVPLRVAANHGAGGHILFANQRVDLVRGVRLDIAFWQVEYAGQED
ncbi:MAG: type II secretion system protein [Planctomycetota bacterium]|nr:type II secretion system protein [Planctomycetota bacterium]MDA1142728.1 type II secretion system protein [Planctomycetota bacterium]